jgi:hypothetical protein
VVASIPISGVKGRRMPTDWNEGAIKNAGDVRAKNSGNVPE